MEIRIRGTRDEVAAMQFYLPAIFPVVTGLRIRKDRSGPLYRLYADVYPSQRDRQAAG